MPYSPLRRSREAALVAQPLNQRHSTANSRPLMGSGWSLYLRGAPPFRDRWVRTGEPGRRRRHARREGVGGVRPQAGEAIRPDVSRETSRRCSFVASPALRFPDRRGDPLGTGRFGAVRALTRIAVEVGRVRHPKQLTFLGAAVTLRHRGEALKMTLQYIRTRTRCDRHLQSTTRSASASAPACAECPAARAHRRDRGATRGPQPLAEPSTPRRAGGRGEEAPA